MTRERKLVSDKNWAELVRVIERESAEEFSSIDDISLFNQEKVLRAFQNHRVALQHFNQTTGYGYDDIGRDNLCRVFAEIVGAESALVSPHILSGTHALSIALFGVLRPGDLMISAAGAPYDTLLDIIHKPGTGSLADFGVRYEEIPLLESGAFDFERIGESVRAKRPKMIFMQRSRGYAARNPFSCSEIGALVKFVKQIAPETIVFCDNCYGEFTEKTEPVALGIDLMAGSMIKNAGGGIAPNGGYISGRQKLVELCANRLTTPSTGAEIGSYAGGYQYFYQGLFLAPHTTAQALKGAVFMGKLMQAIGYRLVPESGNNCFDIIRAVEFDTAEELIEFVRQIQFSSPVDSYVTPFPWDMPGYQDQIIMAAGCFVQGSSIELSCDAPIRPPYIAYVQGGLTYEHVKIAALRCAKKLCQMRS